MENTAQFMADHNARQLAKTPEEQQAELDEIDRITNANRNAALAARRAALAAAQE